MDPFSILMIASGAMGAVGSFMGGRSAAKQYAGQAAVAKFNARQAELDAQAQARATDFAQSRQVEEGARTMGSLRVLQGASGARTDVGAPFMVRSQQLAELETENALIGMEGRSREAGLRSESHIQTLQKKLFRKASRDAFIGGFFGAGSQALGAATQSRSMGRPAWDKNAPVKSVHSGTFSKKKA